MTDKFSAISCATLTLVCASLAASLEANAATSASTQASSNFTGMAHYYADNLHGKRTASGQVHDKNKMTAAHRSLPFGTRLKVTNKGNGKTCEVVVNDRGPFHPKFSIDLSQAAARELGFFNAGKGLLECIVMDEKAILDSIKHVAKQPQAKPVVAQQAAPSVEPLNANTVSPIAMGIVKPAVQATVHPDPTVPFPTAAPLLMLEEAPAPELHTAHLPINDKLPTVFADEPSAQQEHHGRLNSLNEIAGSVAIHKKTMY